MLYAAGTRHAELRHLRMATGMTADSRAAAGDCAPAPSPVPTDTSALQTAPLTPLPLPLDARTDQRPSRPRSVLVVSSDVALRNGIAARLSEAGYTCSTDSELQEVPARLEELQPIAIVVDLDLRSPRVAELFGALKSRATARSTLVVVLGPTIDAEAVACAARHGVADLLPRTVTPELVLMRLAAQLRIQKVKHVAPAPFTVLGWEVTSIRRTMTKLARAGVRFERYAFLDQDDAGVWTAPSGTRVAWFRDPDRNLLSLAQGRPVPARGVRRRLRPRPRLGPARPAGLRTRASPGPRRGLAP